MAAAPPPLPHPLHPTSSSWINQVERWFAFQTDQMIRRGTHTSVQALEADIRSWVDTWNDNPRPFVWTKTAEEIIASTRPARGHAVPCETGLAHWYGIYMIWCPYHTGRSEVTVPEIELSAGTIEYEDTGGGPTIVLLHGLMMDASLWHAVIADLSVDHRCVAPTLPLGAHRHAMHADADLSLRGIARLVAEFLDRLDLHDVTLVGNDTGGALVQLVMTDSTTRVARVVLVSCDAFDNFPPGLTGKTLVLTGKLAPALFGLFMQQMRLRPVRRLPIAFGWLTKRGDAATARWMKPVMRLPGIRRDAVRALRAAAADTHVLEEAAEHLPSFKRPALVVWARGDRVMPPEHGRRLAELLPQGRLIEVNDSYTLIPLDQPARLAQTVREFTHLTEVS
jgi:pimeloyl-ACP methyl ester carboxylesterase